MSDPREALRAKQGLLQQQAADAAKQAQEAAKAAEEVQRDLADLDRILAKHGLSLADENSQTTARPAQAAQIDIPAVDISAPKSVQIERAVIFVLKKIGRRASSGELAELLVNSIGIDLGDRPGKLLSAYLARSKRVDNDRALGGYGLPEWDASLNGSGHEGAAA